MQSYQVVSRNLSKGKPEISEPVQREKSGAEPKELVVELHGSGDCCGGGSHECKADTVGCRQG